VQDVPIMTLEWLSDPDFEELDEQIVVISDEKGYSAEGGWEAVVA